MFQEDGFEIESYRQTELADSIRLTNKNIPALNKSRTSAKSASRAIASSRAKQKSRPNNRQPSNRR
jgi:hypothetical protein